MPFVKIDTPEPGDILRVRRKQGYTHYGIAVAPDRVVHFTGSTDDSCFDPDNVAIRETNLELFRSGDQIETVSPYDSPFSREEVVKRAKSFNESKTFFGKPYSFMGNNCEHFARFIYYDKKESTQVEKGITAAVAGTIATAALVSAIVKKSQKKK